MNESVTQHAERLLQQGRDAEAISVVQLAAANDDSEAHFMLGMWRLIGRPLGRDVPRARVHFATAVALRHDEATRIEAALSANGSGAVADWPNAIGMLTRLSPHDAEARAQLGLLDAMQLDADGRPQAPFEAQVLSEHPQVVRYSSLMTRGECRAVATAAQDMLQPAMVMDPSSGRLIPHPVRTSHGAVIGPTRENPVIRALNKRLAAISRTDVAQGEALSVLHYAPGQQYRLHHDCITGARNQRVVTILVYLNEDFEGGETYFPHAGLTVKPRIGDAILFHNTDGAGRPDPASQHAGLPVTRGVKWLATRWIRARSFDQWRGPEAE